MRAARRPARRGRRASRWSATRASPSCGSTTASAPPSLARATPARRAGRRRALQVGLGRPARRLGAAPTASPSGAWPSRAAARTSGGPVLDQLLAVEGSARSTTSCRAGARSWASAATRCSPRSPPSARTGAPTVRPAGCRCGSSCRRTRRRGAGARAPPSTACASPRARGSAPAAVRAPRAAAVHPAARAPRGGGPPPRRGRGRPRLPYGGHRAGRPLGGLDARLQRLITHLM